MLCTNPIAQNWGGGEISLAIIMEGNYSCNANQKILVAVWPKTLYFPLSEHEQLVIAYFEVVDSKGFLGDIVENLSCWGGGGIVENPRHSKCGELLRTTQLVALVCILRFPECNESM